MSMYCRSRGRNKSTSTIAKNSEQHGGNMGPSKGLAAGVHCKEVPWQELEEQYADEQYTDEQYADELQAWDALDGWFIA